MDKFEVGDLVKATASFSIQNIRKGDIGLIINIVIDYNDTIYSVVPIKSKYPWKLRGKIFLRFLENSINKYKNDLSMDKEVIELLYG